MAETAEMHYLKDYRPFDFELKSTGLDVSIHGTFVDVTARLVMERRQDGDVQAPLFLHGEDLEILGIWLDGRLLAPREFLQDGQGVTFFDVPVSFELVTKVRIFPDTNTALEGLYRAGSMLCTQCEAEGFRKITFYPDRPDVMAPFHVRIEADRSLFPVLLSNGNPVKNETLPGNRHAVCWEDPFPKPSYLFALVAGDLACQKDFFRTADGRDVQLAIYTEHENANQCEHAMVSLKKAMTWDEDVFGLSYDLDMYMIVATNDFNMGAMENKGLNIFNSKYVLARPETATDGDFEGIESVIAHEYFHNWTGNRVTVKNWFQLSLKEGLTVFRDQQFTADMQSASVKRIQDVRSLRARQFPEDAGPMAHSVRPEAYLEMNNFYTATVYDKGAELIRMIHTLTGPENFRSGMDLYFARHDGKAVTCEDFVAAMEDASGADLSLFRLWYAQAGTPVLHVTTDWDEGKGRLTLHLRQDIPDTPGQKNKKPMVIPIRTAFFSRSGEQVLLDYRGKKDKEFLLVLRSKEESFVFDGVSLPVVPSLLRGFSAPVRLRIPLNTEELAVLLAWDSDPFNRWEAGRMLVERTFRQLVEDHRAGRSMVVPEDVIAAFQAVLENADQDPALAAEILNMPSEGELYHLLAAEKIAVNPLMVHEVREFFLDALARPLKTLWERTWYACRTQGAYVFRAADVSKRRLKNLSLFWLSRFPDTGFGWVERAAEEASCMTDRMAALQLAAHFHEEGSRRMLLDFEREFAQDALVMDKWFQVQALSRRENTLARVEELMGHPLFSMKNPNKVRALIGAFASGNPFRFHRKDGAGYAFLAERVLELDGLNPQVGSRMVSILNAWKTFEEPWRSEMKKALMHIRKKEGLSSDIREVVDRALA
ncbi:aminopeptidase N [Desulfobotulus sp. H1]|uniref:Aminopeptidase N n=1 Tax=Desulfobotulus pelophilus TaxID=2823377 RepID=A0ABT3N583_9BACT|nr:aminopeptidase N [Desulfobotulus pelophilus]MCW7752619.1 aminopeptidase N [Desulfobotulus pelophilus]